MRGTSPAVDDVDVLVRSFVCELDVERNSWVPGFACSITVFICVVPLSPSVVMQDQHPATPRFLAALHCHRPVGVGSVGQRSRVWRDPG